MSIHSNLCHHLKTSKFDSHDTFEKLYEFAQRDFPSDGNFDVEWFRGVLNKIDELYYLGLLISTVAQKYRSVELSLEMQDSKVAGYILNTRTTVTFCMNRELFVELFALKSSPSYHAGGLVCMDRLTCLLNVILHETVHMALLICRPSDIQHHSKEFNRITKVLFGHTDSQHGLIPGLNPKYDLETIKTKLKKGQKVNIYINSTWIPAKIVKVNRKKVTLRDKKEVYVVHPGLVKV